MKFIQKQSFFFIYTVILFLFSAGSLIAKETAAEKALSGLESDKQEEINFSLSYISKKQPTEFLPELVEILLEEDEQIYLNTALKALKLYPRKNILPHWLTILKKSDSSIMRKQIIEYIGSVNDIRIVPALTGQLQSPYQTVRKSAAVALEKNGDDRMYPSILGLAASSNPVHRIYSIEAMNHLYDTRFYATLTELLKDSNKSVRIYTLGCLAQNQLKESLHLVRNMAQNDRNSEVRISSIRILGDFHDKSSHYLLINILNDRDRNIRYETVNSLFKLKNPGSLYSLSNHLLSERDNEIKDLVLDTLISFRKTGTLNGPSHILLSDKHFRLRIKAAYLLGIAHEARSVDILVKGLKDPDYRVRAEICNSLGSYQTSYTISKLLSVIQHEKVRYVRSAALYSLKRINDRKSIIHLFDIYSYEKEPVFREILRQTLREFVKRYI
ncbi:MAG: HEAT repeat domain-containing protein [bacterium]|nr:HEAT repeat domain-containing protein [bacterium]